jgi:hypothetical protein
MRLCHCGQHQQTREQKAQAKNTITEKTFHMEGLKRARRMGYGVGKLKVKLRLKVVQKVQMDLGY